MKNILFLLVILSNFMLTAQDDKTVTLTVSGSGKTIETARLNALRSAIEQAFGTFISSKTEILNDTLVKDEIVSVTNGNIQKYDIVSENQLTKDGDYLSVLNVVVSISKVVNYINNKGYNVSFNGDLLKNNIQLQIENEKNEEKAFQNIIEFCKNMIDHSIDYSIFVSNAQQVKGNSNEWKIPLDIRLHFNQNIEVLSIFLINSLKNISMTENEIKQYKSLGKNTYNVVVCSNKPIRVNSLNDLLQVSKRGIPYRYKIIKMPENIWFYDTISIEEIEKGIEEMTKQGYSYVLEYEEINKNYYFTFRNLNSLSKLINLIYNTQISFFNFTVKNEKNTYLGYNIIDDLQLYLIDFSPFLMSSNRKFINKDYIKEYLQKPDISASYSKSIYYLSHYPNNLNPSDKEKFNLVGLEKKINQKQFYEDNSSFKGFALVFSLYDFTPSNTPFLSLKYDEIIKLNDLDKINNYNILKNR